MTWRSFFEPNGAQSSGCHEKPSIAHLAAVAFESLTMPPLNPITSFLGPPQDWIPPYDYYSELNIIDPLHFGRFAGWLTAITVPSFSGAPPRLLARLLPPLVTDLVWQATEVIAPPGRLCPYAGDEQWFFINGILTNSGLAKMNVDCLSHLFGRPITIIQNATDGLPLDVIETSLGKEWHQNTESANVAFPVIYCALKDPNKQRVIVVSHSQGTVIMAVVLRALKALGQRKSPPAWYEPRYFFRDELTLDPDDYDSLTEDEWAKLELYCFANCASEMCYHCRWPGAGGLPWIESFGNEKDWVARLGMLAPRAGVERIHIEGPRYWRPGMEGHLLNEYYLLPIADCWHRDEALVSAADARPFTLFNVEQYPQAAVPRLYRYLDGCCPPPLKEIAPGAGS